MTLTRQLLFPGGSCLQDLRSSSSAHHRPHPTFSVLTHACSPPLVSSLKSPDLTCKELPLPRCDFINCEVLILWGMLIFCIWGKIPDGGGASSWNEFTLHTSIFFP